MPQVWSSEQPVWLSYLLPHWWLFCTRAWATVVLLRSISTPHNPSPWVPSCSSSESSAQQRVRRGKGERERVVHSGFKAPLPRPLSPLFWQFPPSTWPVSTLNPSRSMWVFGYSHTCHFGAVYGLLMSNFARSHCCMFLFYISCGCIYLKHPTWISRVLRSFFTLFMWVSRHAISRLVRTWWLKRFLICPKTKYCCGWNVTWLYTLSVQCKPITIFCVHRHVLTAPWQDWAV